MSVSTRATGYNKMNTGLSLGQAELISKCHFSSYLSANMDMFADNILLSSDHFIFHTSHAQAFAKCCQFTAQIYLISGPFPLLCSSLTFATLGSTSHLELQ